MFEGDVFQLHVDVNVMERGPSWVVCWLLWKSSAFGVDGSLLLGEDCHAFDVKLFVNRGLISHGGLWSLGQLLI